MNLLEVENLTKRFGDFTAVNRISFSIPKGEIFGFLGPNGAGKTTTINVLTGLARMTSGSVSLAGVDIGRDIKKAQRIFPAFTGLSYSEASSSSRSLQPIWDFSSLFPSAKSSKPRPFRTFSVSR